MYHFLSTEQRSLHATLQATLTAPQARVFVQPPPGRILDRVPVVGRGRRSGARIIAALVR